MDGRDEDVLRGVVCSSKGFEFGEDGERDGDEPLTGSLPVDGDPHRGSGCSIPSMEISRGCGHQFSATKAEGDEDSDNAAISMSEEISTGWTVRGDEPGFIRRQGMVECREHQCLVIAHGGSHPGHTTPLILRESIPTLKAEQRGRRI